jgi:hypothetical protein
MEKEFNEKDSIKTICEMIETSRANIKGNAIFFLLWGWLTIGACLINFAMLQMQLYYSYIVWPVMMFGGGVASAIIGYRQGKVARSVSLFDRVMAFIWIAFVVVLIMIFVASYFGKIPWTATQPLIIALYGLGTFISGGALRYRPFVLGGVFCWICAAVAFFIPSQYVLLLVVLTIIVAYLIPAYMLGAKRDIAHV